MLLNELEENVLLHVYGYLDLIDSINLAETCVKFRDLAQLHYTRYKIFNLNNFLADQHLPKRRNRVDATTVLKHIGPFISTLVVVLEMKKLGTAVGASMRKYCVNVKSLRIYPDPNPDPFGLPESYSAYTEWSNSLNLEKIACSIRSLSLIDLSKVTTLTEFAVNAVSVPHDRSPREHYNNYISLTSALNKVFERNLNLSSLCIPVNDDFDYGIFAKLKSLKHLRLCVVPVVQDIGKLAGSLRMNLALDKVEITHSEKNVERLAEFYDLFIQKLAENVPQLKELSISVDNFDLTILDKHPLPSLQAFNLTSVRLHIMYPNVHKELTEMQPRLKHLDLWMYDYSECNYDDVASVELYESMNNGQGPPDSLEQIIYLIANLSELEIFHLEMFEEVIAPKALTLLRSELVIRRILNMCSVNRPTLRLYVRDLYRRWNENDYYLVKFDFNQRKWSVTDIPFRQNYFSDSTDHQALQPCCY